MMNDKLQILIHDRGDTDLGVTEFGSLWAFEDEDDIELTVPAIPRQNNIEVISVNNSFIHNPMNRSVKGPGTIKWKMNEYYYQTRGCCSIL